MLRSLLLRLVCCSSVCVQCSGYMRRRTAAALILASICLLAPCFQAAAQRPETASGPPTTGPAPLTSASAASCLPLSTDAFCADGGFVPATECECNLGCACGLVPNGTLSLRAKCTCDFVPPSLAASGFLAFFSAWAVSPNASVAYSLTSDGVLPAVQLAGAVSGVAASATAPLATTAAALGSTRSNSTTVAAVYPFQLQGAAQAAVSFSADFMGGAAAVAGVRGRVHGDDNPVQTPAATFAAGILPCTPQALSAEPFYADPETVVDLMWTGFDARVKPLLNVVVEVQNLDQNGTATPFTVLTEVPALEGHASWTFSIRQCAPIRLRARGVLTQSAFVTPLPADAPPHATWCDVPSNAVDVLLHSKPDIPSVEVTVQSQTAVVVTFQVADDGGCPPLSAALQLRRYVDDVVIATANTSVKTAVDTLPWKASVVMRLEASVPVLGQQGAVYVTVVARTPGGHSSPGSSPIVRWRPATLPTGVVVAVVLAVLALAGCVVTVVCCLHNRHRKGQLRRLERARQHEHTSTLSSASPLLGPAAK